SWSWIGTFRRAVASRTARRGGTHRCAVTPGRSRAWRSARNGPMIPADVTHLRHRTDLGSSGCCNGMWILEDVVHAWFPVDVAGACADRGVVWAGGAVCPDRWGDRAGPEHGVAGGATQPDERVRAWCAGPAASAGSPAGVCAGAGLSG